jgi:hypothetical protein
LDSSSTCACASSAAAPGEAEAEEEEEEEESAIASASEPHALLVNESKLAILSEVPSAVLAEHLLSSTKPSMTRSCSVCTFCRLLYKRQGKKQSSLKVGMVL